MLYRAEQTAFGVTEGDISNWNEIEADVQSHELTWTLLSEFQNGTLYFIYLVKFGLISNFSAKALSNSMKRSGLCFATKQINLTTSSSSGSKKLKSKYLLVIQCH